jgi:outer membrane receptor protein involved in Fe transport
VKLDHNDPDPDLYLSTVPDYAGLPIVYRAKMPAVSYLDLTASWEMNRVLQVRGGINNVFDKDPPIAPSEIVSGGAPNYYESYDGLGRQVFVAVTARF